MKLCLILSLKRISLPLRPTTRISKNDKSRLALDSLHIPRGVRPDFLRGRLLDIPGHHLDIPGHRPDTLGPVAMGLGPVMDLTGTAHAVIRPAPFHTYVPQSILLSKFE